MSRPQEPEAGPAGVMRSSGTEYGHDEVGGTHPARLERNPIALKEGIEARSALPQRLNTQTKAIPNLLFSTASASKASTTAMRSPQAAGIAQAGGKSGETTPGTRNHRPTKRKQCTKMSGSHGVCARLAAQLRQDVPRQAAAPRDETQRDGRFSNEADGGIRTPSQELEPDITPSPTSGDL